MNKTKIEWCTRTLNPVIGCTFGCPYCYARTINNRFKEVHPESFAADFSKPQFFPERLKQLAEKKPQIIFMDSMSDVADWTDSIWYEVIKAMMKNPQHVYLFLTKRPEKTPSGIWWEKNVWFGATVPNGSHESISRITRLWLRENNNRFISFEPLHENIPFEKLPECQNGIEWFIIGAETGNRKGKIVPECDWIENIVKFARQFGIPVFMKNSIVRIIGEEKMLREYPEVITEWIKVGGHG